MIQMQIRVRRSIPSAIRHLGAYESAIRNPQFAIR